MAWKETVGESSGPASGATSWLRNYYAASWRNT